MKQRRHTPEQVIRKLAEGEKLLNQGHDSPRLPATRDHPVDLAPLEEPIRRHEGQRRQALKELEKENTRLKRIVANQALDIDMLKEPTEGKF